MKTRFVSVIMGALLFAATAPASTLNFPQWTGLLPGVGPQTILFTNHGTITVSNVQGMLPAYPQYYGYSALDNARPPISSNMPACKVQGSGEYSWSFDFVPALTEQDLIILSDMDNVESGTMDVYDVSGQPVDVSGWVLTQFDPRLPNEGFQGSVTLESNRVTLSGASGETSDELSVLQLTPGQAAGRLVFNFTGSARSDGAIITFATVAENPADYVRLTPAGGVPGTSVVVRGAMAEGTNGFRILWDQGGIMQVLGTAPPAPDNTFEVTVHVPQNAVTGAARIGVAAESTLELPSLWADFEVVPALPAVIAGVMNDANGMPVPAGTRVRLRDKRGLIMGESSTVAGGGFEFGGLVGGIYIVEPVDDQYEPKSASVNAGGTANVSFSPFTGALDIPPVMLLNAGAIALPGGSYAGTQPVHVWDWTTYDSSRLVSLQNKGRPPLTVRFWAELKRVGLPTNQAFGVFFQLLRPDGSAVLTHLVIDPTLVHASSPHNFTAFTWDVNSIELPPGKLSLRVNAVVAFGFPVGQWSFPVEVVGLGERWFAGWVKNPQLTIAKKNPYELKHMYQATLPNLPGVGTPMFNEPIDLQFKTVENRFDLGVEVKETFSTAGGWSGDATAKATLTLFDLDLSGAFGGSKTLDRYGSSLPSCTYSLPDWTVPLPADVSIPVYGGALPTAIDICGMTFDGSLGVFLELSGQVSLSNSIANDLRLTGQVTPALNIALPGKASLELGPCEGSVSVKPQATISAPIALDPAANPPVDWLGLCVTLSGKAEASLSCCDLFDLDPGFDLFDPIEIGNCGSGAASKAAFAGSVEPQAPPLKASVAVGPLGHAIAVWENVVMTNGAPYRTAPLYSVFDGTTWSGPLPIAGDEDAGWDPQVAFIGPGKVMVTWVHARAGERGIVNGTTNKSASANGVCSTLSDVIDGVLCGGVGFVSDVVSGVGDFFGFAAEGGLAPGASSIGVSWQAPQPIIRDDTYDFRPVLAGNPVTGAAVVVWLREEAQPDQRPLALYSAQFGPGGWSPPTRLDAASQAMDIQPSVRFDRSGNAAVAWLRDEDADLRTREDRRLLYSVAGRAGWSAPETAVGPAESPWTPSLDFDTENKPVVAFVIPPYDKGQERHWPADGPLGVIEEVRQVGAQNWSFIGARQGGEHPILRISQNNVATVLFRRFGSSTTGAGGGEMTAAVADMSPELPDWHVTPLTKNGQINWRLAGDVDPESGAPIVFWERRDRLEAGAEPVMQRERRVFAWDLAFPLEGLSFSNTYANPGESIEITAHLINLGLRPFRDASVDVYFYDGVPAEGLLPFAMTTFQGSLDANPSAEGVVTVSYPVRDRSSHTFYAVVDPGNSLVESDESNNMTRGMAGGIPRPEGLSVAPLPRSSGMHLAWSSPLQDDTIRHWVWRTVAGEPWELIGSTSGNEFNDGSAEPGRQYAYRITTGDTAGEQSEAATSARVELPPTDPGWAGEGLRLQVITYGGAVHLTWNIVPGARLEATERLSSNPRDWAPPEGEVRELGGAASLSLPLTTSNRFFRLAL